MDRYSPVTSHEDAGEETTSPSLGTNRITTYPEESLQQKRNEVISQGANLSGATRSSNITTSHINTKSQLHSQWRSEILNVNRAVDVSSSAKPSRFPSSSSRTKNGSGGADSCALYSMDEQKTASRKLPSLAVSDYNTSVCKGCQSEKLLGIQCLDSRHTCDQLHWKSSQSQGHSIGQSRSFSRLNISSCERPSACFGDSQSVSKPVNHRPLLSSSSSSSSSPSSSLYSVAAAVSSPQVSSSLAVTSSSNSLHFLPRFQGQRSSAMLGIDLPKLSCTDSNKICRAESESCTSVQSETDTKLPDRSCPIEVVRNFSDNLISEESRIKKEDSERDQSPVVNRPERLWFNFDLELKPYTHIPLSPRSSNGSVCSMRSSNADSAIDLLTPEEEGLDFPAYDQHQVTESVDWFKNYSFSNTRHTDQRKVTTEEPELYQDKSSLNKKLELPSVVISDHSTEPEMEDTMDSSLNIMNDNKEKLSQDSGMGLLGLRRNSSNNSLSSDSSLSSGLSWRSDQDLSDLTDGEDQDTAKPKKKVRIYLLL